MMPEQLETSQRQQRHEIPDVQGIRRRVKTAIKSDRAGQTFGEILHVGAIGHQTTPLQFVKNGHPRVIEKLIAPSRKPKIPESFSNIHTRNASKSSCKPSRIGHGYGLYRTTLWNEY